MANKCTITAYGENNRRTEFEKAGIHTTDAKEMKVSMALSYRSRGDVCVIITANASFQEHMAALLQAGCSVVLIYDDSAKVSFARDVRWRASISWMAFLEMPGGKTCHPFNRNICALGTDCKFIHACSACGAADHGSFACPKLGRVAPPCKHFEKGHCNFGSKCRHVHGSKREA